jgi:hypothetical protein
MTGVHRKRKRKPTSTEDYAAMLVRMVRSYGRRIGEDPAAGLVALRDIETEFAAAVNVGLMAANREGGHSINDLADMLGVSKQAIHKRVQAGEAAAKPKPPRPVVRHSAVRAAPRELDAGS